MDPKKIWANLAVGDLDRTEKFYSALGFRANGPQTSKELRSFFMGEANFIVHFFLKDILKTAIKGELTNSNVSNEIIFTLSAESQEQVNGWASEIEKAGGRLVSRPESFGEGYYGFVFADPDGHRFNVFYM
ncbi:MAG: VOC family protein [Sediminicola sp.]